MTTCITTTQARPCWCSAVAAGRYGDSAPGAGRSAGQPRRSAHASSAAHGSQPLCSLDNPQVDFDNLPEDAHWWHCDAALCALGTTRKHAASREAFRLVDRGYVSTCARLARRAGTRTFVLNSAVGASPRSGSFYLRVKGEVEQDLTPWTFVP
ncbi:hypothetical protein ULG90_15885 [Halopseudomonas pachastrellae]|nr:hypothetical protein ULG90_15885 [Halopseudomonas pachastrellae]